MKKSVSQAKIAQLSKAKRVQSKAPSSVPRRSVSYARRDGGVSNAGVRLYDYAATESATNILRYRHFIKRH